MSLIIIRGNSGSGKSSIAKRLRSIFSKEKTALVEQGYLRRHVLGETGKGGDDNVDLIELVVRFSLNNNYLTILEGIMATEYYGEMIKRLSDIDSKNTHIFYLDISLDETLKRHITKPNSHEFGETELREWYREKDLLGLENEIVINEDLTLDESVKFILNKVKNK